MLTNPRTLLSSPMSHVVFVAHQPRSPSCVTQLLSRRPEDAPTPPADPVVPVWPTHTSRVVSDRSHIHFMKRRGGAGSSCSPSVPVPPPAAGASAFLGLFQTTPCEGLLSSQPTHLSPFAIISYVFFLSCLLTGKAHFHPKRKQVSYCS